MSSLDNEDWFVACSDEEKYTSTGCEKGKLEWTPKPEVMIELFETIDKGEKEGNFLYLTESKLNLDWKCPGRRPPTPSDESDMDDEYEGILTWYFLNMQRNFNSIKCILQFHAS